MGKILVVDRIENNIAVCENRKNRKIIEIDLARLPQGVREGSVIKCRMGRYSLDEEIQKKIEERIQEKMKDIWND